MNSNHTSFARCRRFVLAWGLALPMAAFATGMLASGALAQDGAAQNGAASKPAAVGIGVVDFELILKDSALGKRLTAEGARIAQQRNQEIETLRTRGLEAQEAARQLAENSQQRRDLEAQIRQINFEFQFLNQYVQSELSEFRKSAVIAIDNSVKQAVGEVARERGLAVVFRKSTPLPPNLMQGNEATINQMLSSQSTLYVSPGVDITSEVIQKMDAAPPLAIPTPTPTPNPSVGGAGGAGGTSGPAGN